MKADTKSEKNERLNLILVTTMEDLEKAMLAAYNFAIDNGGDKDCAYNLSLMVSECVANSMRYVNGFDPERGLEYKDRTVKLRLYRLGKRITAYVEDSGTEKVDTKYFEETFENEEIKMASHGRGLYIVRQISDEYPEFIYLKSGKKIRFVKNLKPFS